MSFKYTSIVENYSTAAKQIIDNPIVVAEMFAQSVSDTVEEEGAMFATGEALTGLIPVAGGLKLVKEGAVLKNLGKGNREDKRTGNNSNNTGETNNFIFVENAKDHLKNVEYVNTKKGIVGGHNMDEFNKALKSQGFSPNDLIVSKKPHKSIEGIYEIEYKIPRKDMAGNIAEPVSYKNIKEPKTVYDPSKISNDKIYQWGQEAMQNGKLNGRVVEGIASNGLKYRGYLNEAGEITNFFPMID